MTMFVSESVLEEALLELEELNKKIASLEASFNSSAFNDISRESRGKLTIKLVYMKSYSEILTRIISDNQNYNDKGIPA